MTDVVLAEALNLARMGYPVFPCNPDKTPRIARGFKSASTDRAEIYRMDWDGPTLIGAAIPEGQVVIDIDPRNGGAETWKALASTQDTPPTRMVSTRSGGTHFYFAVPEGGRGMRSSLGPGVDVKKAGKGYVIAPPSKGYELLVDEPPAPMPQWLLSELVVETREGSSDEAHAPKYMPFEQGTPYGLAALHNALGSLEHAVPGERNNALNKAAFGLAQLAAGGEIDADYALERLHQQALNMALSHSEAMATLDSGWRAGEAEPRQAPNPSAGAPEAYGEESRPPAPAEDPPPFKWVNWNIEEPEPPFYAHPLLPENAYVLVYGATEAAKSMTWLGLLAEGSRKGLRSSIYSLENPPATDRDRLRRWEPDPANLRLTNEPLDLFSVGHVDALVEREVAFKTQVIMIDTYSHAFSSHSEDGNAKAIAFARRVRYIMAQTGATVIVIDHTGFQGDEPRDASAKRQAVDVAILMEKNGDWVFGQDAKFTMRNMKAARFGNPFYMGGSIGDGDDRKLVLRWSSNAPEWRI